MAVGWPLGLGHDTTGWPLGLRLRLTQENLQWSDESPVDNSPSYSSSSLDTQTTRSFSQEKNLSLGTLIGLPISRFPAGSGKNSRAQKRNRRNTRVLRVFPAASTSSRSKSGSEHRRSGSRSSSRHSSHGSNRSRYKNAASVGWALLSLLSCARVPSVTEDGSTWSKASSKSTLRGGCGSELSTSNLAEIQKLRNNSSAHAAISFMGRNPSPVGKFYDNIAFEEDCTEPSEQSQHSSEWNPLFASSSLADDDVDVLEEDLDAVKTPLDHMKALLMRSHSYSESSQVSDWSSGSESFDPSSSSGRHHLHEVFGKHSSIHTLLSRMVCYRQPQTVES